MINSKFLKLARLIMKFAEVTTDKGLLVYEGELEVGTEIQIEDADGNVIPAPNDEYTLEDGRIIVVADGKISEIKEVEPVEEPVELEEEPVEDPRIAELEALVAEKEAIIAELNAKIEELEAKINAPVEEPLEFSITPKPENDIYSKISNFFN